MAVVAAVAMTLISPAVMKAIIPADSHQNWDRRQYVAHIAALILIWWTAALVPPLLIEGRDRLRQACRNYGVAAALAAMVAVALLFARQVPTVLMIVVTGGTNPMGLIYPRLFDVMEHAPDACAAAVLAAWSLLALSGTGVRPSNWLEKLCLAVGVVWVLMGLSAQLVWVTTIPWLNRSGITW
jgi:hypothetical protein